MVGASILNAIYNSGNTDISYPSPTSGYSSISNSYSISFNPNMGWFFSDKTVAGASLIINPAGNKTSFESGNTTFQRDKENTFNIGAGGFVRNYFGDSDFMPFGQAGINLGIMSIKREGFFYGTGITGPYKTETDGKSDGGFFANGTLSLGLTKLLNPHTGLDFYVGYIYSTTKHTFKSTTTTDIGLDGNIDFTSIGNETRKFTNHGFQVGIGFQVFLDPR